MQNIIFEKRVITNCELRDGAFYQNCECGTCTECKRSINNHALFVCNQGEEYDIDSYTFLGDLKESEAIDLADELASCGKDAYVDVEEDGSAFCVRWS